MTHELHIPGGRISEAHAIDYTKKWRHTIKDIPVLNNIKAFFIPKDDIDKLHAQIKAKGGEGIRAYLAIKDGEIKLVMVPVFDVNGVLRDKVHNFTHVGHDFTDVEESDVYDFTRPCPSLCDDESPLNGIGVDEVECTDCHVHYDEQHA